MSVYLFRTTNDKLPQHVAEIESVGDAVEHYQFVGGRDWTLVVRKSEAADEWEPSQRRLAAHAIPGTPFAKGGVVA